MNCIGDHGLRSWEEGAEKGVNDESAEEAPYVEESINLRGAADTFLEGGVDGCCPVVVLVLY
jgi:hypothetical protein